MLTTHKCHLCGAEFQGGPRAAYCPNCQPLRRRELAAKRRVKVVKRPLGSAVPCRRCGEPFVKTGGKQYYCQNCAAVAVMEIDRQQGLDYYNSNREEINRKKREKRKENKS